MSEFHEHSPGEQLSRTKEAPLNARAKRHRAKRARQKLRQIDLSKSLPNVPRGKEVKFGPFLNVPAQFIHEVGWACPVCQTPVQRAGLPVPNLLPRLMLYACACGASVTCWEDELQPSGPEHWRHNLELANAAEAGLVMFSGGKDTPPDFQAHN